MIINKKLTLHFAFCTQGRMERSNCQQLRPLPGINYKTRYSSKWRFWPVFNFFFKSKHQWESWLLLEYAKELRLSDECQRTALRTYTNCVYARVRVLTALWRMKRTHRSAGDSAVWVWHSRSYLLAYVWCSARWEVFYSWLETCSTCSHKSQGSVKDTFEMKKRHWRGKLVTFRKCARKRTLRVFYVE